MEYKHTPVMLSEVLECLSPCRGGYFIDCTLGGGGYTSALSQIVDSKGKILAIDLDKEAIENTRRKNLKNVILAHDNFKNLSQIIKKEFDGDVLFDGIVLDLGLSSYQLEDRNRGFSFREDDQPLNMSFDQEEEYLTKDIVNNSSQKELEKIIFEYGEEKYAKRIASQIIEKRKEKKIETTGDLIRAIEKAVPKKLYNRIHPATKTFQALRIATNAELKNLEEVLPQAVARLKPEGRLAVISFHSLEDRIVKNFFRKESRDCICPPIFPECRCNHKRTLKIVTKKPISPKEKEINENPRARSAKMRVAQRV